METNTINVTLFNQVASKRHLNLNQLLTNAFSPIEFLIIFLILIYIA